MYNTIKFMLWIYVCVYFASYEVESRAISKRQNDETEFTMYMEYLANYGYMAKANLETGALRSVGELETAVKQFQRMAGLTPTGKMDSTTFQKMNTPRCGMPDMNSSADGPQKFALGPSKWDKNDITYRIKGYTQDLYWQDARRAFYDAFRVWSDVSPLRFSEVNGNADIEIFFASTYHDDGYAFDGPGQVLAHAFPPGKDRGGDAHFDDDERWTVQSQEGTNLFTVAAHEFGHSLGIYHSNVPGALMYPWYQGYNPNLKLHSDDIRAIQTLYGAPRPDRPNLPERTTPKTPERPAQTMTSPIIPTRPTPRPTTPPYDTINPCTSAVDAVSVVRGEVFAFKGRWFWRLNQIKGLEQGYPVEISRFWEGLPAEIDSIDAVYERPEDRKIIFFKGSKFWEFDGRSLVRGFPKAGKSIQTFGLPSSVTHIDAALVWGLNKRTYFFSGYSYWKIDTSGFRVDKGYPKATENWKGIPIPVDAAFTHFDGKTYFFKGTSFWSFSDKTMQVEEGYPKPVKDMWVVCSNEFLAASSSGVTSSLWVLFAITLLSTFKIVNIIF